MMNSLWKIVRRTPHLFSKVVVLYCVAAASGACAWCLRILSRTGHDPAGLLAVILGFFGGELLLLCLKTVLKQERPSEKEEKGGEDR